MYVPEQELIWLEERHFRRVWSPPSPSESGLGGLDDSSLWLILDRTIAEGPHYTTYAASFPSPALHEHRSLVMKLARLSASPNRFELGLPSSRKVISAVSTELSILTGPLARLQGDLVPRLYGVWTSRAGGDDDRWVIWLLEKAGGVAIGLVDELSEGDRSVSSFWIRFSDWIDR